MFLHQGVDILITSIDIFIKQLLLQTVSNINIPDHSIEMIPKGKYGIGYFKDTEGVQSASK